MKEIVFFDTEVESTTQKIIDIGGINNNGGHFHSNSINEFVTFINGCEFICGHNIITHDLTHIAGVASKTP